jgi:hypothetical protein
VYLIVFVNLNEHALLNHGIEICFRLRAGVPRFVDLWSDLQSASKICAKIFCCLHSRTPAGPPAQGKNNPGTDPFFHSRAALAT